MKAFKILALVVVIAAVSAVILTRRSTLEDWARNAPLEFVHVEPSQTASELIKARVPSAVLARGDLTFAIEIVGERQNRRLGNITAESNILLPIPYGEWAK